ncbi:MAG: hypothetical protein U1D55_06875 [Phycisphaerae bacterium]
MRDLELMQLLPRYADGDLAPEQRDAIDRRLAVDPALRAELQRMSAMRASVKRAMSSDAMPAGLEARVRASVRGVAGQKTGGALRLSGVGVALAAAVVLLAMLVPTRAPRDSRSRSSASRAPVATPLDSDSSAAAMVVVGPDAFSQIHRQCGDGGHDGYRIGRLSLSDARRHIASEVHFPFVLPDLSKDGLELECACPCFPSPHLRALHATYHELADFEQTVSLFSFNQPLMLSYCSVPPPPPAPSGREYDMARDGDVTVLKWDDEGNSFAVAGRMDARELSVIADASAPAARLLTWALAIKY